MSTPPQTPPPPASASAKDNQIIADLVRQLMEKDQEILALKRRVASSADPFHHASQQHTHSHVTLTTATSSRQNGAAPSASSPPKTHAAAGDDDNHHRHVLAEHESHTTPAKSSPPVASPSPITPTSTIAPIQSPSRQHQPNHLPMTAASQQFLQQHDREQSHLASAVASARKRTHVVERVGRQPQDEYLMQSGFFLSKHSSTTAIPQGRQPDHRPIRTATTRGGSSPSSPARRGGSGLRASATRSGSPAPATLAEASAILAASPKRQVEEFGYVLRPSTPGPSCYSPLYNRQAPTRPPGPVEVPLGKATVVSPAAAASSVRRN